MKLPTVTILCSSYNSSRWIEGYCRAVNAQLLESFRLVFVDAASSDDSLRKFRAFPFRGGIETSVIECDTTIPIYQAWNMAIEASPTDYCMNINTDDRIYPAGLLSMLHYAAAFPEIDVLYSRCFVVADPDHRKIVNLFDWPEYSHEMLLKMCICGPFPLLKRSAVIAAGMFDPHYTIAGDYEMWLRMSKLGYSFRKVPETIGSFYFNPVGRCVDKSLEPEKLRQEAAIKDKYQ